MNGRWQILALLFAVRLSMAFQFEAVAALPSAYVERFAVDLADLGILIGLYLSPGILLAIPGAGIGRRFGDKRAVLAGLALMATGGLVMVLSPGWSGQFAGRVIAGTGGILLNVLMTKMVADWFDRRELATAMAIFVNSWPAGIALALLVLPRIEATAGLDGAQWFAVAFAVAGFLALLAGYRSPGTSRSSAVVPPASAASSGSVHGWPAGATLAAVVAAATIWGLFNAALAMIFSFGPALLAEQGMAPARSSSMTSVTLWVVVVSVPLGGLIADRLQRPNAVMIASFLLFAAGLLEAGRSEPSLLVFMILGFVAGLPAGPIMSLPAKVLSAGDRALGMGVFFTVFYISAFIAPIVAGGIANMAGTARATFDLGAIMLIACLPVLALFHRLARQQQAR
ncbi:MAG: MFS transporter [Geminicoccaceae bacterium]